MTKRSLVGVLILALIIPFIGTARTVQAVTDETTLVVDFVAKAPEASWKTSAVPISFGGLSNDTRGFARYVAPATMEDGSNQRSVLETHPQWVNDGWIEGTYNNIVVPSGAELSITVGFLKGATGSNGVLYSVRFQENGSSTWYYFPAGDTTVNAGHLKTYDTKLWTYSWSLADLAGKTGKFVLRVHANGSSGQDWACWQRASITALGVPRNAAAHAAATNVVVDWDYAYTASLLTSLSFEVQARSFLPGIWLPVGTVSYPDTSLTLNDQAVGIHTYRTRAVEKFTLFRPAPLPPLVTYTYSDWSPSVQAWVLAAPTGVTVARVANAIRTRVSWAALDAQATGYQVLRKTDVMMLPVVVREGPATELAWIDTDVLPNKKYYYQVRAVKTGTESGDADGSGLSDVVSVTTSPESPGAQLAVSSGQTITVSWTHSGNCSEFHIWCKPVRVAEPVMPVMLPSTQRSYAITDAEFGRWTITIAARSDGGGYSPETPALDAWVLTAPSAPLGNVSGATTVTLTWGAPDVNATSVRILRSVSEGPFAELATVASGVLTYADTSCAPSTTYAYKLQALRDDDASALSPASVALTTPAAPARPAAPTNLAATAQSSSAVALTWTDNATNETYYRVYRQSGALPAYAQVSPDLPAGTGTWQDTTVAASTHYTYKVLAGNAVGDSDWSNEAGVTTPAEIVLPPATPTGATATAESAATVRVTWLDNATNETMYLIERSTGAGAFVPIVSDLPAGTALWKDTSVQPSTTYSYRVKARNAGGDSGWSNTAVVTTPSSVETVVIKLTIDKTDYTVNGVSKVMDVAPVIRESRTLGPVRYIAEALGADVQWDPVDRKATVSLGSRKIELWIGKNTARVDGSYVLIDPANPDVVPLILPPGRTMLPFRFIAEQLGAHVDWDPIGRVVTITYPA